MAAASDWLLRFVFFRIFLGEYSLTGFGDGFRLLEDEFDLSDRRAELDRDLFIEFERDPERDEDLDLNFLGSARFMVTGRRPRRYPSFPSRIFVISRIGLSFESRFIPGTDAAPIGLPYLSRRLSVKDPISVR